MSDLVNGFGDLLPMLGVRETWIIGIVLIVAVLRPVGRLGWFAAGTVGVAGVATVSGVNAGSIRPLLWSSDTAWLVNDPSVAWGVAAAAWIVLAIVLAVTAIRRPLRWEPRTGPSAATALIFGALVLHVGAAWHAGGPNGDAAALWGAGTLGPDVLAERVGGLGAGPLAWVLGWLPGGLPGVDPRTGAAALGFVAVVLVVLGAERLGRRWGNVGTGRCIAAAIAWSPPLLLAHAAAPVALLATAGLVWSWWALAEVWAGRHRPGRLAFASGLLLGVAAGVAVWPALAAPLWVRRLGRRTAGWFAVGIGLAALATELALVPVDVGLGDAWNAAVVVPVGQGLLPVWVLIVVLLGAAGSLGLRRPLSPTRLSAATAALLLLTVPWWPPGAEIAGPVAAMPFVLLASVAPDRPDERWPPDAGVLMANSEEVGV